MAHQKSNNYSTNNWLKHQDIFFALEEQFAHFFLLITSLRHQKSNSYCTASGRIRHQDIFNTFFPFHTELICQADVATAAKCTLLVASLKLEFGT